MIVPTMIGNLSTTKNKTLTLMHKLGTESESDTERERERDWERETERQIPREIKIKKEGYREKDGERESLKTKTWFKEKYYKQVDAITVNTDSNGNQMLFVCIPSQGIKILKAAIANNKFVNWEPVSLALDASAPVTDAIGSVSE